MKTDLQKALDRLNKTVKALKEQALKAKASADTASQSIAKLKREQDNAHGKRYLRVIH